MMHKVVLTNPDWGRANFRGVRDDTDIMRDWCLGNFGSCLGEDAQYNWKATIRIKDADMLDNNGDYMFIWGYEVRFFFREEAHMVLFTLRWA